MKIQINNIHSNNSLSLIKLLKEVKKYDIAIIGSDTEEYGNSAGSLLVDKYYIAPQIEHTGAYIKFLNEVYKKEKVDLLIPASDAEALVLSKYKKSISVNFYLASADTVRFFKDKLICTEELSQKGFCVPPVITDLKDQKKVIFRKRISVNSIGIYVVDLIRAQYIENHFNNDYFIQPYLEGETYIVDILSDKNGIPVLMIPRKTIEIKDGTAFRSEIVNEPQLIEICKRICSLYTLPGFCNMDFIKLESDYYFIENNVRFAGSGIFSAIASFNFMELYLDIFVMNKNVNSFDYYMSKVAWGAVITRYYEEKRYIPIKE